MATPQDIIAQMGGRRQGLSNTAGRVESGKIAAREGLAGLLGLGPSKQMGNPAGNPQKTGETDELMQLMMGALMDPKVKADDVGAQLMQMITMDSLTGNKKQGNTPAGMTNFLRNILGNMAAEQQRPNPQAGRR